MMLADLLSELSDAKVQAADNGLALGNGGSIQDMLFGKVTGGDIEQ